MRETGGISSRPQPASHSGDPSPVSVWRRRVTSPGGWRLLLSASEIIGGAVGAVVFIAQALDSPRPVWHTAFAVLFSAVSVVAGWRLLRRLPGALGLSIA